MDSPDTSTAGTSGARPQPGLRRRLLGAGIVGLAGSLLPSLAARASAATPDDAAPTTTAPPQRPTGDDVVLLQFAQSVELAVVELYGVALGSNGLGDGLRALLTETRATHVAYAQSLAFCEFIERQYGRAALVKMIAGGASGVAPAQSFEAWVRLPLTTAFADWRAELELR